MIVAYDEAAAQQHALRLFDHLSRSFESRLEFTCTQCRFDQLAHRQFASEASAVASSANLVIIGTVHGEDLPSAVKKWIIHWLEQSHPSNAALVAAVKNTGQNNDTTRVHAYLQDAANQVGVSFFPGVF